MITSSNKTGQFHRSGLSMALLVTRREVRDSFRDWRIIFPLLILTFFFRYMPQLIEEGHYLSAADPTKSYVPPTAKPQVPHLNLAPLNNGLSELNRASRRFAWATGRACADGCTRATRPSRFSTSPRISASSMMSRQSTRKLWSGLGAS